MREARKALKERVRASRLKALKELAGVGQWSEEDMVRLEGALDRYAHELAEFQRELVRTQAPRMPAGWLISLIDPESDRSLPTGPGPVLRRSRPHRRFFPQHLARSAS